MISATESYVKTSIIQHQKEQAQTKLKEKIQNTLKENAKWLCDNYIVDRIETAINNGELKCNIYAMEVKEGWQVVQGSYFFGKYNQNSKGYYDIPYFKYPVDLKTVKELLVNAGYKVSIYENAYKEANTRTGKYCYSNRTIEMKISWESPNF